MHARMRQSRDAYDGFGEGCPERGSVVAWYGMLPVGARGAVTLAVGLLVSWIAFRVAVRLVKGLVRSVVAAVLAFLLATVPGNLILHDAYAQLREKASMSAVM